MKTNIIPQKLYKYQRVSKDFQKDYSYKNLKDQTLWFPKPESLNDPFDCNINFRLADNGNESLQRLFVRLLELETGKNAYRAKYTNNGEVNDEFKNNVPEMAKKATKAMLARRQLGVSCFSECNENILMWAHYTNSHQGFCLEFDTSFVPFKSLKTQTLLKVDYSEKYPPLSVNDIPHKLDSKILTIFGTKSPHWGYEKEWRMFASPGDRAYPFDPSALTGVYLGCKMDSKHKLEIAEMLINYPNAKLYQMHRSESEFKLYSQKIF